MPTRQAFSTGPAQQPAENPVEPLPVQVGVRPDLRAQYRTEPLEELSRIVDPPHWRIAQVGKPSRGGRIAGAHSSLGTGHDRRAHHPPCCETLSDRLPMRPTTPAT